MPSTTTSTNYYCPKCGYHQQSEFTKCPRCGNTSGIYAAPEQEAERE